jgi:hypothetical protein
MRNTAANVRPPWRSIATSGSLIILACTAAHVIAANCNNTSVGLTPINDLGAGLYLGQFQGGLYPSGSNAIPAAHAAEGLTRATSIQPLNPQGQPNSNGKFVLLSIGMSNTTQEYSRFMQLANNNAAVNHPELVIVDGAAGGQTSATWDSPTDQNYDRVRDQELAPLNLTEAQVVAAWVKTANAQPSSSLPNANADAYLLVQQMGNIVRAMKVRYPNLQLVFFSSRIYAGYASTTLNPEPYAYESAFAVKWVIEAQIEQMAGQGVDPLAGNLDYFNGTAPWLAWGPYTWADGLTPRSDGLTWQCSDFSANDGTHPSPSGREKVATMLLNFMLTSPAAKPWFAVPVIGDVNGDSAVNINDLLLIINNWGACQLPPPGHCPSDVTGNGATNIDDLLTVINHWSP